MDEYVSVRSRNNITDFMAQEQSAEQRLKEDQAQLERNRVSSTVTTSPSEVLKARCKPYTDDGTDIMTNAILQQNSFSAFRLFLDENGIELLPTGVQKIYSVGIANKGVIELRDDATWMKVYEYLCELRGFFTRNDLIVRQQPLPETEKAESAPKIDDRQALEEQMVTDYYGPRLQGFLNHLKSVWDVELHTSQIQQIQRWFERNDLPLTGENFDKFRREVLGLYSQQESAEIELENTRTLDSPSAKREYLRRLRAFD